MSRGGGSAFLLVFQIASGIIRLRWREEGVTTKSARTHVAALTLLFLLTLPAVAQNTASDLLIVPGSGIGRAQLGMSIADVLKVAGPPRPAFNQASEQSAAPPSTKDRLYYWFTDAGSRAARTDGEGRVSLLELFGDARFATSAGLHVGSTQVEVEQILGTPSRVLPDAGSGNVEIAYDALGILFFLRGTPSRVAGIAVFAAGTQARP